MTTPVTGTTITGNVSQGLPGGGPASSNEDLVRGVAEVGGRESWSEVAERRGEGGQGNSGSGESGFGRGEAGAGGGRHCDGVGGGGWGGGMGVPSGVAQSPVSTKQRRHGY